MRKKILIIMGVLMLLTYLVKTRRVRKLKSGYVCVQTVRPRREVKKARKKRAKKLAKTARKRAHWAGKTARGTAHRLRKNLASAKRS